MCIGGDGWGLGDKVWVRDVHVEQSREVRKKEAVSKMRMDEGDKAQPSSSIHQVKLVLSSCACI